MLQVAAYCRVSTDKEDQANSFEAQQRYFREYIQRQPDWELQGIYADEGFSGTSTNKRVEFNKMLHAAELGQIDLIVTKEVSRFTRNTVDALQITRELRRRGVGVLFLNDSLDTRTNDGELRLTIMSSFAQDESRRTSERSKWGQMRSMEKGVVFGGSLLGYDVIGGKMTVNPEGAEVVRLIFHKYLQERKGCSTIARELREAGILSSKGNCLWSSATVTKILKNEKYCGDLIQKKTYTPDYLTHEKKYNHGKEPLVELKDHHEPIIDRETWQAVQRELSRRNRATGCGGHGNRYPLSGKIRCGECGKSFSHRTKKRQDGSSYYRWCCFTATNEGLRRTDGAGNVIGCSVGRQIRDDIAMDLLRRSVNAVTLDKKAITSNLACIVESVLASGEDSGEQELRRQLCRAGSIGSTLRSRCGFSTHGSQGVQNEAGENRRDQTAADAEHRHADPKTGHSHRHHGHRQRAHGGRRLLRASPPANDRVPGRQGRGGAQSAARQMGLCAGRTGKIPSQNWGP